MLRSYKLNLDAYGSHSFGLVGEYIRIKSCIAGVLIETESGESIELGQGEDAKIGAFKSLTITNLHSAIQTIKISIGSAGSKISSSTVSGVVEVISGEISRTKANRAFIRSAIMTSSAANYPIVQYKNPAGSGKNVFINQILLFSSALVDFRIGQLDADINAAKTYFANKKIGQAESLAYVMSLDSVTDLYSVAGYVHMSGITGTANTVLVLPIAEPIMLEPGRGLAFGSTAVNSKLVVNVQSIEEDI